MRVLILASAALMVMAGPASAGCTFATGPCYTDNSGNTYRTERNFGGGYNTRRNGNSWSQTNQDLSGGYQERFNDGRVNRYNSDPYSGQFRQPRFGTPSFGN